jgi:uncharacterized membrane protein (DUF485 family)
MDSNRPGHPDEAPEPPDLTPVVGGWTDVAPLAAHPAHERTAEEDAPLADWDRVAAMPAFRLMIRKKVRFVTAATVFFVVYYFALPVSVGYFPRVMDRPVLGPVNLAYLFALSQFFMAWLLAFVYVRVAARFDRMSRDVLAELDATRGGR